MFEKCLVERGLPSLLGKLHLMDAGRDLYLADFYSLELRDLGQAGFASWLAESFRGAVAAPKSPHFYTEELETETFGEIFSRVAPRLASDSRALACDALRRLLEEDGTNFLKYEGLFSIARIAEGLGLYESMDLLNGALRQKLHDQSSTIQVPETELEVYCLRETLECFFRAALSHPQCLKRVCAWSLDFFQSGLPGVGGLKPILAPVFVLARIRMRDDPQSDGAKESLSAHFTSKLLSGFYLDGEPFPEFYEFRSMGELYPYDIDSLRGCVDEWLQPAIDDVLLIWIDLRNRYLRPLDIRGMARTATRPDGRRAELARPYPDMSVSEGYLAARLPAFETDGAGADR